MTRLLRLAGVIDRVSLFFAWVAAWLVLLSALISAFNAASRYLFSLSSNAWLEIQWYLFAAVFMLGAGYAFLKNAHVRIDFISSKLSTRANTIIDILGIVVFLVPLCLILIDLSWPLFTQAYASGEMSQNAGGLIRWPVLLMIPAGFAILLVQALSELIKRVAYLQGLRDDPMSVEHGPSDEEKLAAELAAKAEQAAREGARA